MDVDSQEMGCLKHLVLNRWIFGETAYDTIAQLL